MTTALVEEDNKAFTVTVDKRTKGRFPLYSPGLNVNSYLQTVDIYFALNKTPDDEKALEFITSVGQETANRIIGSLKPDKIVNKSYDQIVTKFEVLHEENKNVFAERHRLIIRRQEDGESLDDFAIDLQNIVEHCEVSVETEATLVQSVFVAGIRNDKTRESMLRDADHKFNLSQLLEKAKTIEIAALEARKMVKQDANKFNYVGNNSGGVRRGFLKPGKLHEKSGGDQVYQDLSSHRGNFKVNSDIVCYNCYNKGHLSYHCTMPKAKKPRYGMQPPKGNVNRKRVYEEKINQLSAAMEDLKMSLEEDDEETYDGESTEEQDAEDESSNWVNNVMLVPILPDYLIHFYSQSNTSFTIPKSVVYKHFDLHYVPQLIGATTGNVSPKNFTSPEQHASFESENGSIGILLAVKALVQLVCNPIVGNVSAKLGYSIPIFFGTLCMFLASVIFAFGQSYASLFVARAIHGVGSACVCVCGMSLVAQLYTEPDKRSKIMGTILGSIAVGVLIGYPFGGIAYDIVGKAAPFHILTLLCFVVLMVQCLCLDFSFRHQSSSMVADESRSKWIPLLTDRLILVVIGAIWISTSAMSILEPCLPLWMISVLHPKKWQLGTVFIPDSIGYWIGTNFFGGIAYRFGQIKIAILALTMVGVSCVVIPSATSVFALLLPHFGLGLGIGVLDAALVPLLATMVDSQCGSDNESDICETSPNYGAVYAIQQIAVSLAYSLAPILGGELVPLIGFPWLMRAMGMLNLLYGPLLVYSGIRESVRCILEKRSTLPLSSVEFAHTEGSYRRFYNAVE